MSTKPDTLWLKPVFAVHLHFIPEDETLLKLQILQARLAEEAAAPLLQLPKSSLHMTVATLVRHESLYEVPAPELWERSRPSWTARLVEVFSKAPPVHLCFNRVETSSAAVFVRSDDGQSDLSCLRTKIADAICLDGVRLATPKIAHITLARYAAFEPVFKTCYHMEMEPIYLCLRSVNLLEEYIYPSIDTRLIEVFSLQG